ncbi:Uncharacterized protein BM_BM14353 [Brugia malayi]|uniref:Uncharacterized protein n=1 Tax=Brugia malayi TaxID=6279 RepID=A0A4E9FE51_BRUMA|nr:Uncharacterized protein BM_BM14353 [Brugia malayi]VIO95191.1 Uncharacterized protein BM_BM14353 [Brugia malayi]
MNNLGCCIPGTSLSPSSITVATPVIPCRPHHPVPFHRAGNKQNHNVFHTNLTSILIRLSPMSYYAMERRCSV